VAIAVLLLTPARSVTRVQELERIAPFSCDAGAVDVTIGRKPPLAFVPIDAPMVLSTPPRAFSFADGPVREVRIYLTATLPESNVGMASEAGLSVYVETAASAGDLNARRTRWWQLARRAGPGPRTAFDTRTSERLVFDAKIVGACFGGGAASRQDQCQFAQVALATDDSTIALITIGFTQDLGGANSLNWTDANLLLDFRGDTPRVIATADCDYNEGGGACTAIDSGEMMRMDLSCRWTSGVEDFLCTQTTDESPAAHRDFYLLSNRQTPARPGELSSLEEALNALASRPVGDTVLVTGRAPAAVVADAPGNGPSARLLYSGGTFHLVPLNGVVSARSTREPRLLLPPRSATKESPAVAADGDNWTRSSGSRLRSRAIYRRGPLTIFEVVATPDDDQALPASDLYWVGVETVSGVWYLDALRLAGSSTYEGCGRVRLPPMAASIGPVRTPFRTELQVRPAVLENPYADENQLEWLEPGGPRDTCLRRTVVSWRQHRFEVTSETAPCRTKDDPPKISLTPDGRLMVQK
jgi:hypothetical protein